MGYESAYERVLKKLTSFMDRKGNMSFTVLVNNALYTKTTLEDDNVVGPKNVTRLVHVRYNRSPDVIDRLDFGTISKVQGKNKFIPDHSITKNIIDKLLTTNIHGIELGISQDDIDIDIECNLNLNLINIKQNYYTALFKNIYVDDVVGTLSLPNGKELSTADRTHLYEAFDRVSMKNYYSMLERKMFSFIKKKCRSNNQIKFFYTFDVYRPMLISGSCIFNPLLDSARHSKIVKNSEFYRVAQKHRVDLDGLSVCFMTDEMICKTLHFRNVIKLVPLFITNILLGTLHSDFANKREVVYRDRLNPAEVISLSQYTQLPLEARGNYEEYNLLRNLCENYYKTLRLSAPKDLYAVVAGASLF